ncbi:MAG TPA: cytochrome c oxidase assembly factor Coa1 family protein [Xanthomonadaceae bacterium]|jgi:hypothetical protein
MDNTTMENTSGQGDTAVVPPELRGWNWGAFLLTWIWGIGNNVLLALLTLVPIVGLVMWFVLGVKGNEWAWRHKRWDSVEHFRRVQRSWAKWGVIVLLATLVLTFALVSVIFFAVHALMQGSDPYRTAVARLRTDPAATKVLGEPVNTGWPSGSMHTYDGESDANLDIPVTGSIHSGVLHVEGTGRAGRWHYQSLDLRVDGRDIDLRRPDEIASPDQD